MIFYSYLIEITGQMIKVIQYQPENAMKLIKCCIRFDKRGAQNQFTFDQLKLYIGKQNSDLSVSLLETCILV